MTNRRNVLVAAGIGVVVALVVAIVVWQRGDGGGPDETTEPKPTVGTDVTTAPTAPPSTEPATTTTFMASVPIAEPAYPTSRDALSWPFPADSIWNMPLGAGARLVPAGMRLATEGVTVDEDILVLEPSAPRVDVIKHDAGWDPQVKRCAEVVGTALLSGVPIPTDFVTDPGYLGATPNHAAAILLADGDTVVQTQPLHRCQPGGPAVSQYLYGQDSLHSGTGIPGAHGGSQMSSIGGTLRLGELVPGGAIHHALKLNIDCESFCAYDRGDADGQPGFRWPATAADYEAPDRYKGKVAALQMGALLALPADFDVDALRTEPARMVARAMQRYGAYVVDDTRYPVFAFTTEWSPQGRVIDEFEAEWGFSMHDAADGDCDDDSAGCAWVRDIGDIVADLSVVDDNSAATVGGGGTRVAPCAPAFADGRGAASQCVNGP